MQPFTARQEDIEMTGQTENIYFTALIKHTHVGCC